MTACQGLAPVALAAGRNIELLAAQARDWRPPFLAVQTEELAARLRGLLPSAYQPAICHGLAGYARLAALAEADCVLSAQAGSVGVGGTLAAALAGHVIALANKESLVVAGGLLRRICARSHAAVLPVDSEHYALFQCLAGNPAREIASLILTASGGPFLGRAREELAQITPAQALRHPNWKMGPKITIDSATLMNKGLEYIEAAQLFGVPPAHIKILIHPQSIVHSLAQFTDASLLGQLAVPDMRLPIAACLCWPRRSMAFVPPLNLAQASPLSFCEPDLDVFPCLRLAMRAAAWQGHAAWRELGLNPACIVLNAANEDAVGRFLKGEASFLGIGELVGGALARLERDSSLPPELPQGGDPAGDAVAIATALEDFARKFCPGVTARGEPGA